MSGIIETFDFIEEVPERIQLLIDYADRFKEVPEQIATRPFAEDHRVPFCESKALAAILDETLSGLPAEQIMGISPDLVFKLFGRNISMGKGQGLMAMVSMVKSAAKQVAERQ